MKKVIPWLVLAGLAGFGVFFYFFFSQTHFNEETAVGNSPGNLLNGGLFREEDGKIYFSNFNDDGSLYVMNADCTGFKKLADDRAAYINTAGSYLFYGRKNNERESNKGGFSVFMNTGLFRINRKGKELKTLFKEEVNMAALKGNYLYYSPFSDENTGYTLNRVKIDGSGEREISKYPIIPAGIDGNTLYYTGAEKNHNIYAMNLNTLSSDLVYEGNCAYCIPQDDYLYFLDLENNYALTRVRKDGGGAETLVQEFISAYNISTNGKYLYYQVDGGDNNRICRFSLDTREETPLTFGDYNSIHVTSNYIFFRQFGSNTFYMAPSGESGSLSVFNPPAK